MNKQTLKDMLYAQVARIGKAVSSPKRLELLKLLAQGKKTVEALAAELSIDINYLTREIPPRVANMKAIVRVNLGLGA